MNGNHLTPQGMFINSPFESTLHDSKRAPVSEITRGFSNVNPLPQYSDAHPYGMNLRTHSEREINREKIFISCLQKKNSADTAYDFKIDFPREIKNIKRIKVISIAVDYTPDSTAYRNGFLYFDNMESSTTIDQKNYHIYFPITQGVSGTQLNLIMCRQICIYKILNSLQN